MKTAYIRYLNLQRLTTKLMSVLFLFFVIQPHLIFSDNIGLAIVATGKYIEFVDPLIASAEKHFCKDHNVTYFVYTDADYLPFDHTVLIYQEKLGWPLDSLKRFKMYYDSKKHFEKLDYVFAIDADSLFVDAVGDEILSEHTAVIHSSYAYCRGTYETNPQSKAYIGGNEGQYYYAKTFWGGTKDNFFEMCKANMENVDADLKEDIKAVWQDESHWNRYCVDHYPRVILSPSYFYPEVSEIDYPPRILGLSKNHTEMRK